MRVGVRKLRVGMSGMRWGVNGLRLKGTDVSQRRIEGGNVGSFFELRVRE